MSQKLGQVSVVLGRYTHIVPNLKTDPSSRPR